MSKILIIPDIHHRVFWKDCVKNIEDFDKVIFLGDYLDPYPFEGAEVCDMDAGFLNLKEIIKFKEDNREKVVLLLGNHDLHYIYPEIYSGRYDNKNAQRNTDLFAYNLGLFDMMYECEINGKRFVFSHAGFMKGWVEAYDELLFKSNGEIPSSELINGYIHYDMMDESKRNENEKFVNALNIVSSLRGGYDPFGSMIWSDVRERLNKKNKGFENVFQVFSHTYIVKPIVTKDFACLDVQRGFILEDGVVKEMDGTVVALG